MTSQPDRPQGLVDRVRLEALRYAVNEEAAQYIAIMRLFTSGLTGLLSDQSASEIATALTEVGHDLDDDTVESRLSYLVEHGNLARSPRETEARSEPTPGSGTRPGPGRRRAREGACRPGRG